MAKLLRNKRTTFLNSEATSKDSQGRPVYTVKLGEREAGNDNAWEQFQKGTGPIHWVEQAFERDFSIGTSAGYLFASAVTAAGLASGGAIFATSALLGMALGATSDYFRNSKELEQGVEIGPPTRFNRDAVRKGLTFAALTKLGLALGTFALNFIPGVSIALPALAGLGVAAAAGAYGFSQGSEEGYNRMKAEYNKAAMKAAHPDNGVSVQKGISQQKEISGNTVENNIVPFVSQENSVSESQQMENTYARQKPPGYWTNSVTNGQLAQRAPQQGEWAQAIDSRRAASAGAEKGLTT